MATTYVSVGGASDREIHDVFRHEASGLGVSLTPDNYLIYNAPRIGIATAERTSDFEFELFHRLERVYRIEQVGVPAGTWCRTPPHHRPELAMVHTRSRNRRSTRGPNAKLCLVGKSAGAIQIWNLLRLHLELFEHFQRVAAVLIDPHGAVIGDEEAGTYRQTQPLTWPDGWPRDHDRFRVYHIMQHLDGLTGAPFKDPRVYSRHHVHQGNWNHTNIPEHWVSRWMIRDAVYWSTWET